MGQITSGYTYGSVDSTLKVQTVTLNGIYNHWGGSWNYYYGVQVKPAGSSSYGIYPFYSYYGIAIDYSVSSLAWSVVGDGAYHSDGYHPGKFACDRTFMFRAWATSTSDGTQIGSALSVKAYAIDATISAPTFGTPTSSSCTVACDYYPNTYESTANVVIQYKKTTDSSWTDSSITATLQSGYSVLSLSGTLSGLEGATTYQVRLSMTRTTVNSTSATGAVASFTTEPDAPDVTTDAASGIGSFSATLNGTVSPNGVSTYYSFEYGETVAYGSTTAEQGPDSGTSDVPYAAVVGSLDASTTYHFRAVARAGSTYYYGSDATFSTSVDPGTAASTQPHFFKFSYDAIYGQAATFYFALMPAASSGSFDSLLSSNELVAGDAVAYLSDNTSLGSVTTGYISPKRFYCTLTATQMQNENIYVLVHDQTSPPVFRDAVVHIRTKQKLGQVSVVATNIGGNETAVNVKGVGTSTAISATGGATATVDISGDTYGNASSLVMASGTVPTTYGADSLHIYLASGSSAVNDFYNGSYIFLTGGTGAGQCRVITDYVGSSKLASVVPAWTTAPVGSSTTYNVLHGDDTWNISLPELTALTTDRAGDKLQLLFQRFAFKIEMDATTQTWYRSSGATLYSRNIYDTTTEQRIEQLEG